MNMDIIDKLNQKIKQNRKNCRLKIDRVLIFGQINKKQYNKTEIEL